MQPDLPLVSIATIGREPVTIIVDSRTLAVYRSIAKQRTIAEGRRVTFGELFRDAIEADMAARLAAPAAYETQRAFTFPLAPPIGWCAP